MFEKIKKFLFENTSTKQTVAKNSVWLAISNFGGRLIKAAVIIYAARALGTADYGIFSYAVTLAGFFSIFVDPGLSSIMLREGGRSTLEERRVMFSTGFVLRAFFIVLGALLILFVAPFFTTLPGAKLLIPVIALIVVFDSVRDFLLALFRSLEKMEWEAGIFLFTNLAIVIAGFFFLHLSSSALYLGWGYAIGSAIGSAAAIWAARDYFSTLFSSFSLKRIAPILQSAWPFVITGALGMFMTNLDILVISWMKTASDVGIYSAAIRIIQVIYIIPGIIQYSTLPVFARLAVKDPIKFRAALERTLGMIFAASIPLSLGGAILAAPIMMLIFGNAYLAGALSFSILMLGLSFDFASSIMANAVFSHDRQKSLITTAAIGGGMNLVFDIILIPRFGIAGSAVATLISQIASNWYLWSVMKKINYFAVMPSLKKVFAASAIMAAATALMLFAGVHVVINVALSGGIYILVLYVLREPLLKEIKGIMVHANRNETAGI